MMTRGLAGVGGERRYKTCRQNRNSRRGRLSMSDEIAKRADNELRLATIPDKSPYYKPCASEASRLCSLRKFSCGIDLLVSVPELYPAENKPVNQTHPRHICISSHNDNRTTATSSPPERPSPNYLQIAFSHSRTARAQCDRAQHAQPVRRRPGFDPAFRMVTSRRLDSEYISLYDPDLGP